MSDTITFYGNVKIGQCAFEGTTIETIIVDKSNAITFTVQPYAFANCAKLSIIKMENKGAVPEFDENSFYGVNDLTVYVGNKVLAKKYESKFSSSKIDLGLIGEITFLVAQ